MLTQAGATSRRDAPSEPYLHPLDAYGSSIRQRACWWEARGQPPWPWGRPGRYCDRAGYRDDVGGASCIGKGPCDPADRSALLAAPVGGRFTSADTRGKSAPLRVG
jgi:hypothetical protein